MSASEILIIGLAAAMAGAMNSVAGGGTFFSFPALLAVGVPPVVANASNAVALWPASLSSAWAYRRELARFRTGLVALSLVALVGGIAGGLLLLSTKDDTFSKLIPWLLLVATVMFAGSGQISALLARLRQRSDESPSHGTVGGLLFQLGVSIYGGFFGAGMGIVMIAALAIQGHRDIHDINALKNWLSAIIYSVAVVTFVAAGAVSWPHTLVMIVTAAIGGYWGAVGARKVPAVWLRRFIIGVGSVLTTYYFYKTYLI